jgi:phytoene synthase
MRPIDEGAILMECLKQCEAMIAKGSLTFYSAFRSLPSPRRQAVYVIYAFCRMIDDAVDEPEQSPYTLGELKEQFDRYEQAGGHFIWPALRWLFQTFPALGKEPFFRQMEGQQTDLDVVQYETMEQLDRYCYLVAGTVGEMLLPVLHDDPDEKVTEAGIMLGKAMQIVNIVRDVGEDRRRGRRYIPKEWMDIAGYCDERLDSGIIDESFVRLIGAFDRLARDWFAQGLNGLETYPRESACCIEIAARYYEAILDEVKENGYDVFTKRAVVGGARKLALASAIRVKYTGLAPVPEETAVS